MSRLRSFRARTALLFTIALLASGACVSVRETPAAIRQGGRAVAISIEPGTDPRLLVASETGGLFVTDDGGSHWKHVDALPSARVVDVEHVPSNGNFVLATTRDDYLASPNGGIWRSGDRGRTWSKVPGAVAPPGPRCPPRPSAWGISAHRISSRIVVGTDCGLAMSDSGGVSWFHAVVDPAAPVRGDQLQDQVWSVLSLPGPRIYAAGRSGIAVSFDGGGNWILNAGSPGGQGGVIHAFAVSPLNQDHVFVVGRDGAETNVLFLSTDAGRTWTRLRGGDVGWQRPGWVRTARAEDGTSGAFDLYFGAGRRTLRSRFTDGNPPTAGTFVEVPSDHADPSDIAISNDRRSPRLLATDGGVHRFDGVDNRWEMSGAGPEGGYNALQVTEMTGQIVGGGNPHLDLYFGTQDNGIWASADGGTTWQRSVCCEGFHLQTPRRAVADSAAVITGCQCAACKNFQADSHLANRADWNDPPNGRGQPFLVEGRTYIQFAVDEDPDPDEKHLMLTTDFGANWVDRGLIPLDLVGRPRIAVDAAHGAVLYNAIRRPGSNADGSPRLGLVRIANLLGPGALEIDDADDGIVSLGTFPTMFAWYRTFGVDPTDSDRLLAPDIGDGQMKSSFDGGQTWGAEPALTDLVTGGGTYRFDIPRGFTLVSSIAWDPDDSCHLLVGTRQSGVLRSTDDGRSWTRIRGSQRITDLSSFFFESPTVVRASSYGRGLWRIKVKAAPRPCLRARRTWPPPPPVGPELWDPGRIRIPFEAPGDPPVCPQCSYLLVHWGEIVGVEMADNRVRAVRVSGGLVRQVGESGRAEKMTGVVVGPAPGPFGGSKLFDSIRGEGFHVRGLVLEAGRIRGVITSPVDLEAPGETAPFLRLRTRDPAFLEAEVSPGGELVVEGSGFAPGHPVEWSVDGEPREEALEVGDDGRFQLVFRVGSIAGTHELQVEQRSPDAVRSARELFRVVARDPASPEG